MKIHFFLSMLFFCQISGVAQLKIPELSPAGSIKQSVGFTTIIINYERPAARHRSEKEIFGTLVPYGKVWRTGAGTGTRISFSTDVYINDQTVHRGTYSLFTIPEKKNWTVILNTDTVAYGAFSYDEKKDVVRVNVEPRKSDRYYESLTFDIDVIPNDARIYISWLNTQIAFDVGTGIDKEILSFIHNNLILHDSNDPDLYESAIIYYIWHNIDRKQVLTFVEKGIALKNERIWYYWKVKELMKDKRFDEALAAAHTAIEVIRNAPEEEGYKKSDLIKDFENYIAEIKAKKKSIH